VEGGERESEGAARQDRGGAGAVRPNPNVVSREVGNEVVLVHLQTNRIYTLNKSAARLWDLLQQGRDLEEAQEQLLDEFDVDEDELRDQVTRLVGELSSRGLVDEEHDRT
jgi:Coenzyme PQQ synthesis protein D (PqqD)